MGPRDVLRWRLGGKTPPELPDADHQPPIVLTPSAGRLSYPPPFQIAWLGHASVLVQLDGLNVVTDPTFGAIAFGLVRRLDRAPLPPDKLPRIDAVLVSHNHYDHCDLPSLRALRRYSSAAVIYCPLGLGAFLRARIGGPVVELSWGEHERPPSFPSLRIHALPAQHWSVRTPRDERRSHWCSFRIEGPSGIVYFAGDTGFGPHFEEIARRFPQVDVAVLPIGAYAPRWFMHRQHMGPAEAISAARLIGARLVIPMHWGTYRLTDEPLDEPPRLVRDAAREAGQALALLRPGELWPEAP